MDAPQPSNESAVELLIDARARPVGNVSVARFIPVARRRHVGPFVFLDRMGPVSFAPGTGFDVAPHPHIGLSTVTYLFEGEVLHRDSLGSKQLITPGAINLMTAGRGVVHSERSEKEFRARGGTVHGAQLWLGLPLAHEDLAPAFEHRPAESFPEVKRAGAQIRVLMGTAFGSTSPLQHPANPLFVDVELQAGATLEIPDAEERAVCLIDGAVSLPGQACASNQMLVLKPSAPVVITAKERSRILIIGGPKLDGGERFIDWNFVASTKEKIAEAKAAWIAQTFPKVPGDEDEFIPLHENH